MLDIIKKRLNNGLIVYFYKDKNMKRTLVSYNVKYGTCGYFNDFTYQNKDYHVPQGMAHFLEHLLIEKSKYGNMAHRFREKNYSSNGETSYELTSYYFIGIEGILESLKELVEMVDDPVFTSQDVEDVKPAIIDETRIVEDNPYRMGHTINLKNTYQEFDYSDETGNILGHKEVVESITYEDVLIAYKAFYNTENKFLLIGGNIDVDEYLAYLNEIEDRLEPHPNEVLTKELQVSEVRTPYQEIEKREINLDYIIASYKFKLNQKMTKNQIGLYLHMFMTMKFTQEKDFVAKMIKDGVIVGGLRFSNYFFKDYITINICADVLNKDEFLKRIEIELQNLGLDPSEFELIKKSLIANDLSQMDYIYNSLRNFPSNIEFTEKIYNIDTLEKSNLKELETLVKQIPLDNRTVTYLKKWTR